MNHNTDKREFDRFPIEFVMEVAAEDSEGERYKEKTVLKDISGNGAKFITQQARKYFPGQSLEMTIYLPGTNDVKADMRGTATVVRIDSLSNSGIGGKSREMCIAVKLETPLKFQRVDVKKEENSRKTSENL
jgi:hypothetical protein